ncbi:MAG: TIGR02266 family protein [Kofleriaceae bacterium]
MPDASTAGPDGRPPIELKVEYKRLNSFFADYTRNISRGGTFIKTGRPLPVGSQFMFRLSVPRLPKPLSIHGEVEAGRPRRRGEASGMSIRFVYRLGDSREQIARTVDELMIDSLGQRLHAMLMERGAARAAGEEAGS